VDLVEEVAQLKYLQRLVASAAPGEANGMAKTFQDRVKNVTLKKVMHPPYTFYKATPGQPPAYASGNLTRSILMKSAYTAVDSSAIVYSTAVYAALQEWGGSTWPSRHNYMHWRNNRGPWWKKKVDVPEHPYMRPTLEAVIRDGTLQGAAISAFEKVTAPAYR
jgi:phage gpG-like protein